MVVGADPKDRSSPVTRPNPFKVEGIGEDFIPRTFDRQVVDEMIRVSDRDSFNTARRLAREEGLLVGGSAGTAPDRRAEVRGAAHRAQDHRGPPARHGAQLPHEDLLRPVDAGKRLLGIADHEESPPCANVLSAEEGAPEIISVSPEDTLQTAIELFHRFNISQIPGPGRTRSVGSLQESTLLALVFDGVNPANQRVGVVMGKPLPTIDMDADLGEAYRLLLSGCQRADRGGRTGRRDPW